MTRTITGLERLCNETEMQKKVVGKIGYLCHSASIDHDFQLGVIKLQKLFKERLIKLFGPQHGFVTDVQDNMVETKHYIHPFLKLPVYSLYSETRIPTDEMLEGINTLIVDLQDVGTRVYTYISTLALLMEKCQNKDIKILILDRPNPVGGELIEGTILKPDFKSFVGMYPIPQRHSLTMAEVAMFGKKILNIDAQIDFIPMINYQRKMFFKETNLPWVLPSPNLPTMEGAITFVGTVLFEGTNISEGRGTTRALEICGHPNIEPFSFVEHLNQVFKNEGLTEGFTLRPIVFLPTFQKHHGINCGGIHIHPTDNQKFKSWSVSQIICRELYHHLGSQFQWNDKPYEYEFHKLSIDLINGTDQVRHWVEKNEGLQSLKNIENEGLDNYLNQREKILIYR